MEKPTLSCGIDIHFKKSFFCIIDEEMNQKELIELPTEKTKIENLMNKYKDYNIQVAFEAGGMSRFFYRLMKSINHVKKIHVVHPQKFKIITESKHKNDKNDSKKLAKALLKDYLPYPVHIKSDKSRKLQLLLNLRKTKVKNRTSTILQTKAVMRGLGIPLASKTISSKKGFKTIIESVDHELYEYEYLQILLHSYENYFEDIKLLEKEIETILNTDFKNQYELLISIPGIGIITSAMLISTIDNIERFNNADQLSSYFGLIPSEHSSGSKTIHGKITKEGNTDLRSLMIQAAWTVMNLKRNDDKRIESLRKKFYRISRKNKNSQKAIVAIARHLSRIVFGVLKNSQPYYSY